MLTKTTKTQIESGGRQESGTMIPNELTRRRQWGRWKLHNGNKIPLSFDGTAGKSNDPSTWCDFTQISGVERKAFFISAEDPFTGIDLDNAIKKDGEYQEWAIEILNQFKGVAYCEVSPSKTGVKLTTRAVKPSGAICVHKFSGDRQQVECYDKSRFWAMTGLCIGADFKTIGDGQAAVNWLCEKYLCLKVRSTFSAAKSQSDLSSNLHIPRNEFVYSDEADAVRRQASLYVEKVSPVSEGSRNLTAFNLAGHLRAFTCRGYRLTDREILDFVLEWNAKLAEPLSEEELQVCVESSSKNGRPRDDKEVDFPSLSLSSQFSFAEKEAKIEIPVGQWLRQQDLRNENSLAVRFVDRYENEFRFVPTWKTWLYWDGKQWHRDEAATQARRAARDFSEQLWKELAGLIGHSKPDREEYGLIRTFVSRASNKSCIDAYLSLAGTDSRILAKTEDFDAKPMLLNVKNGTVDLEQCRLLPHDPGNMLMQLAEVNYDPEAQCPQWRQTISFVFDGDAELERYFQQLLGYGLYGLSPANILPIWFGTGNNGKSTIWNTVAALLGNYAMTAPQELLLPVKHENQHDRADLFGKRFVMVAEPDEGRKLAESQVKMLTGGSNEKIRARRLYENSFEFVPSHLLSVATNHKPKITGTDQGIWRRLKLIPFVVDLSTKTEPKEGFAEQLIDVEGPGILNWLLAGFRDWRLNGFVEAEAVKQATAEYRTQEDQIQQFIESCCVLGDEQFVYAGELYDAFKDAGYSMWKNKFGKHFTENFETAKLENGKVYRGIGLLR